VEPRRGKVGLSKRPKRRKKKKKIIAKEKRQKAEPQKDGNRPKDEAVRERCRDGGEKTPSSKNEDPFREKKLRERTWQKRGRGLRNLVLLREKPRSKSRGTGRKP